MISSLLLVFRILKYFLEFDVEAFIFLFIFSTYK